MTKKSFFKTAILISLLTNGALFNNATAQVTIGSNKTPETFSALELISSETRGMRLPQMTTEQRDAMASTFNGNPEAMGLQIFNTCTKCIETWNGTQWFENCAPCVETDGVMINGVMWATRNVDMPNTFAECPESYGMLYQWNRKIGWSATDPMINSDGGTTWDSSTPTGTTWETQNDPCPAGWRVPTLTELQSLVNTTYVTREWNNCTNINGCRFTDIVTGNSVFLPATGFRYNNNGAFNAGCSHYWSSTEYNSNAYYLFFCGDDNVSVSNYRKAFGQPVRCVAE